jgi:predicted nucleic acid-binding protein
MQESIYLDTSVPSAYYDHRAKERQEATVHFWKDVIPNYRVFISEITIDELQSTKDNTSRNEFLNLVSHFKVLKMNQRIENLAKAYVKKDIIPGKYIYDAYHAAIAAYYNIDYLISWNFDHLVKAKTRRMLNSVNILEGCNTIEIISPPEL